MSKFKNIKINNENIVYLFKKCTEKFPYFINTTSFIINNKTFTPDLVYNNLDLPWDFKSFRPYHNIDSRFILANLQSKNPKNWNIYELIPQFTFYEMMIIFELNRNNRSFFIDMRSYMHLVLEKNCFDFNVLLSIDYPDGSIQRIKTDEFIEHPKFEMIYVRAYPYFKWNWKLLTLHGKMTMEEAINFMKPSRKYCFISKILENFDNLMLQPWMNVDFIHKYVSDPNDRRFYLRQIQKKKEEEKELVEEVLEDYNISSGEIRKFCVIC